MWLLRALLAEKVVQHGVVTWALATDRFGVRDGLALEARWLAVAGGMAGALFAVSLFAHVTRRRWSMRLAGALAIIDVVGEFIAQGTFGITVTISFVVAIAVLVLVARGWSRGSEPWLEFGK